MVLVPEDSIRISFMILTIFLEISEVYLKTFLEVVLLDVVLQDQIREQISDTTLKFHFRKPFSERKLKFLFSMKKPVILAMVQAVQMVLLERLVLHVEVQVRFDEVQDSFRWHKRVQLAREAVL